MNKDKVITIRISGETYDKIKKASDSVSNFVRDAVDNTINAAKNFKNSVEIKTHEEERKSPDIYAFQNVVLAKDVKCEKCGKDMKKGEDAFIGFDSNSSRPHFFCTLCKKEIENHHEEVQEPVTATVVEESSDDNLDQKI